MELLHLKLNKIHSTNDFSLKFINTIDKSNLNKSIDNLLHLLSLTILMAFNFLKKAQKAFFIPTNTIFVYIIN